MKKIVVSGLGCNGDKFKKAIKNIYGFDEYDLAGLKLTDCQKALLDKMGVDTEILITALSGFIEKENTLEELIEELHKEINVLDDKVSSKRKRNNWKKKRFYE